MVKIFEEAEFLQHCLSTVRKTCFTFWIEWYTMVQALVLCPVSLQGREVALMHLMNRQLDPLAVDIKA